MVNPHSQAGAAPVASPLGLVAGVRDAMWEFLPLRRHGLGSIEISIRDGQVSLDGPVANSGFRSIAGELAARVAGVTSVRNRLITDAELESAVAMAFAAHAALQPSLVRVDARLGTVRLEGVLASRALADLAGWVARRTPGVLRVESHLAAPLSVAVSGSPEITELVTPPADIEAEGRAGTAPRGASPGERRSVRGWIEVAAGSRGMQSARRGASRYPVHAPNGLPRAAAESTAEAPVTRHSIAIVDDQADIRELLAFRFGMVPGLDIVGQAANGAEALQLAREVSPDLMTLDLRMPVMGGVEAIPLLRGAAPGMRIVVYTAQLEDLDSQSGSRPDAAVLKGANLGDLVAVVCRLLADGPQDVVIVDLGRLPVQVALDAFDSWVGLNARVREALATKGDVSSRLLGDAPVNTSELLCLMGVFMQFGMPLMLATAAGHDVVDLRFTVTRQAGAAARRALLALGGNGTLRAFNQAWSHSPTQAAEQALDLVDSRLIEQLPTS